MDLSKMIRNLNPSSRDGVEGRRYVGYWYSDYKPDLPDPVDFMGEMGDRELISQRLALGTRFIAWRGFAACRICGALLGTRCMTMDGTWVWPERLEHYVLEHQLVLPPEFVQHLLDAPEAMIKEVQRHKDAMQELSGRPSAIPDCPDKSATCQLSGDSYQTCTRNQQTVGGACGQLYWSRHYAIRAELSRHEQVTQTLAKIPWV